MHTPQLLDAYPLSRACTVEEACEQVGRSFSPHRLAVRRHEQPLALQHNQLRLRDVRLNTLSYGADVLIDPGQRGDFFMVQLPLAGHGLLRQDAREIPMNPDILTVLQPRSRCQMQWSGDCQMILVQVPREVVEQRSAIGSRRAQPRFASMRRRDEPEVAAWWQAVLDLTRNLDRFGAQWLRHPAASAAMEEFLLSGFTALLAEAADDDSAPGSARCVRRAKEYIAAHLTEALALSDIARYACVSPRTLEAAFRREGEAAPLVYARRQRLAAAHARLCEAAAQGRSASVTPIALAHGFLHMGRFAAQYRAQYGCSPSETLRLH